MVNIWLMMVIFFWENRHRKPELFSHEDHMVLSGENFPLKPIH